MLMARNQRRILLLPQFQFLTPLLLVLVLTLTLLKQASSLEEDSSPVLVAVLPLLSQNQPRQRQSRRRLEAVAVSSSSLEDNDYEYEEDEDEEEEIYVDSLYRGPGTHYVDLFVGCGNSHSSSSSTSPQPQPQRQTLIVDTGSSVTAFPCQSYCRDSDCGVDVVNNNTIHKYHLDDFYNPNASACFRQVVCPDCLLSRQACSSASFRRRRGPRPQFDNQHVENNACKVELQYTEGSSWTAVEVVDRVYVGGTPLGGGGERERVLGGGVSLDLHFACQTSLSRKFQTQQEDGILGMRPKSHNSYWDQLYQAGLLRSRMFSLCFKHHPQNSAVEDAAAASSSSYFLDSASSSDRRTIEMPHAGAMILGNNDNSHIHSTPLVHAKLSTESGYYVVHLEKIHLRLGGGLRVAATVTNGENAQYRTVVVRTREVNEGEVIVDSGTSYTYLSANLVQSFNAAWQSLTGEKYDTRRYYKLEDVNTLPTVLLQLTPASPSYTNNESNKKNGPFMPGLVGPDLDPRNPNSILVAFPPSQYLSEHHSRRGRYHPRIYFTRSRDMTQTLGSNFMQGKMLQFDMELNRLGFAESGCDYFGESNRNTTTRRRYTTVHDQHFEDSSTGMSDSAGIVTDPTGNESLVLGAFLLVAIVFALLVRSNPRSSGYQRIED